LEGVGFEVVWVGVFDGIFGRVFVVEAFGAAAVVGVGAGEDGGFHCGGGVVRGVFGRAAGVYFLL
jgi:hypothetical protein